MSWGVFTHNIALLPSAGYSCSALEDAYGASGWYPFIDTAETPTFPDTGPFELLPPNLAAGVWEYDTLPEGNRPPIDVCSPDPYERFFVQKNGVGGTIPFARRLDQRVADDTLRTIIGPAGQILGPASEDDARLTTNHRFRFHFENANGVWSTINFNVKFYLEDSDLSGEWDRFVIVVSINGSCSYLTLSTDTEGPENSITKEAYQALWPSLPFSGPQPVEQYTTPIWTKTFPVEDIFPDLDNLWAPMSIELFGNTGIESVALSGNPSYTDRGSWWCHIDAVIKIANETFVVDMPGDLVIAIGGNGFNTTAWPTTSATSDNRSANIYFWAANTTNNRIAIGGLGDETISWNAFKTAYDRNKL